MLNSITLSSDQDFIFLIDDGDAVAYSLEDGDGVVIGLLGDQLTAASAHDGSATQLPFAMDTAAMQWQLMYIPESKTLYIFGVPKSGLEEEDPRSIGSTDIDPGRSIGSSDIDPGRSEEEDNESEVSFDLSSMVIILHKEDDEIVISTQPK